METSQKEEARQEMQPLLSKKTSSIGQIAYTPSSTLKFKPEDLQKISKPQYSQENQARVEELIEVNLSDELNK